MVSQFKQLKSLGDLLLNASRVWPFLTVTVFAALDNSRLLIRYWDGPGSREATGPAICIEKAGNVQIVCENITGLVHP
jgi:hypothetical protein